MAMKAKPNRITFSCYPCSLLRCKVKENDAGLNFKSDTDYTEIVTVERKYLSNEPLRYWSEILDPAKFARSHKSFIINTSKIYKMIGNRVTLTDKTQIPIGRAYKEAFLKNLLG